MAPEDFFPRLLSQQKDAQHFLIQTFNPRIFFYFRARIKNETNYHDLVQEVFSAFFNGVNGGKVRDEQSIAPFIFGIAKRVMFNYFHQKKRDSNLQKKIEGTCNTSYDFRETERLENEQLITVLNQQIERLNGIDRTILKEFYLKEQSIGEVAAHLGRSKHYISVRKERAIKKLKHEMARKKPIYGS
jgi:RNA polymerase sigma factor (sigma-70 family)